MAIRFLAGETIDGALTVNNTITLSGSSNSASTFTLTNTAPDPDSTWTFVPQYNSQDLVITGTGKFDVVSSGGTGRIDTNGQIESIQALDVSTAGGRLTGKSDRGYLASIHLEQTATSTDGGYIRFLTAASGTTSGLERFKITDTGAFSVGPSGANYGSSGQVLTSQGNGLPTWTTPTTGTVTGSGTTNYIPKFTSGSAVGNSTIFDDGKIGIGTASISASAFMEIKGVGSLTTAIVKLLPSDSASTTAMYTAHDGGDNQMSQYGTASGDTILQHIASSGDLLLRVNGTTGLTMDQSQNVGINIGNPATKLDVYQGDIRRSGIVSGGYIELGSLPGYGVNAYQCLTSGGSLHFANNGKYCAYLEGADTVFGILNTSAALKVKLNTNGDSYFTGGDVGIGTTAPTSLLHVSGNSYLLGANYGVYGNADSANYHIKGSASGSQLIIKWYSGVLWQGNGTTDIMHLDNTGDLTVKGDVVAYGSPSDKRLKENIKPIESALDKVQKLQGVTFDWKKQKQTTEGSVKREWKHDMGFIAQDVKKVVPELVRENEDGLLSMRHQGVIPILVEAIKEQQKQIDSLQEQIKKMSSEN
jgi:hypothetical protein